MRASSNFELRAHGRGHDYIEPLVRMAFEGCGFDAVTHFMMDLGSFCLCFTSNGGKAGALPYPHDPAQAALLIIGWLQSLNESDFGPKPNVDGSAIRDGWFLESASGSDLFEIVRIKPQWTIVHK